MAPKPLKLFRSIPSILGIGLLSLLLSCSTSESSEKSKDSSTKKTQVADIEVEEEKAPEKPKVLDWTQMSSVAITCNGSEFDLASPLLRVANSLESQKLMYNVQPFTDCSGIFHRVLDSINRRCPGHGFPDPATHRSSRDIGRWYDEKGNFIKITDPKNEWEYIKPGAVMFYVSGNVDPKTVETEALFKPGGIRHVGVVVDVEKDKDGMVNKYTLFHGRTNGKVASKTNYHERVPSRASYPAYGNGRDHWIGVAPIASDKVMDGQETQANARTTTPPPRTINKTEEKPNSTAPKVPKADRMASSSKASASKNTTRPKQNSSTNIPPSKPKKTGSAVSNKSGNSVGNKISKPSKLPPPKADQKTSTTQKKVEAVAKANQPKDEEINLEEWAKMEGISINCEGSTMNLALPLNQVASRLESQNLMYNVKPFTDCSGIFHRVLDSLDQRCPSQAYPDPKTHRDSRSIGRWYDERGGFTIIRNPEKQWEYIKPGAVMFYVSGSKDPKSITREELFKPGGIRHIGVVVDVEKDKKGVVQKYTLFHGRTTGKPAAKTNYHSRKPSRSTYPAYGNGRDHWIGIAQIASDSYLEEVATEKSNQAPTPPPLSTSNSKAKAKQGAEVAPSSEKTAKEAKKNTLPSKSVDNKVWASKGGLTIKCEGGKLDLSAPLDDIASRLEAQNLMYNVKPFSDCSGIFHRVLDSLDRRCPSHAFPSPQTHRSSRDIGRWYLEKGSFVKITDPENSWKYIKPGAVMFYVSGSLDPKTVSTENLFKPGGIRHIGVVVDVEKDAKGVVQRYTLFHGRTSGKPAAKTNYHVRKPSRSTYPAYGNGRDHWIGVAQIASDKVMD